ncbi:MAG: hypothetical protein ACOYD0_12785, partial [Candidatus Nanopelagicales bacterium]
PHSWLWGDRSALCPSRHRYHNKKRAEIRNDSDLSQEKRLRLLWDAWVDACGDPFQGLLDIPVSDE